MKIEDVLPILNEIAIFGGLSEAQLHMVFKLLEESHYDKGEFIFETGDPPSHIYIVRKGQAELLLDMGGTYLAKNVFTVGECFGEVAAIGIEPHTASVMATEPTDLIVLPKTALFSIWNTDKELFGQLVLNIAREACRRLSKTNEVLLHYFTEKNGKSSEDRSQIL